MIRKFIFAVAATMFFAGQTSVASEPTTGAEDMFAWHGSDVYIGDKNLDEVAEELIAELIEEGDIQEEILIAQR